MSLKDDLTEMLKPWRTDPKNHSKRHMRACRRTFIPYDGNNNLRKYMALGLFTVWMIVTLGEAFGFTEIDTVSYGVMSAAVYTIIGIQWGFEFENLPITVNNDDK